MNNLALARRGRRPKQVEGNHRDLGGKALQFVLQNGKVVVQSAAGATTSPSMIAEPALICQASSIISSPVEVPLS